jgi:hypothetical protein
MLVKVYQLKEGMMFADPRGKGLLTVESVRQVSADSYELRCYGLQPYIYHEGTRFDIFDGQTEEQEDSRLGHFEMPEENEPPTDTVEIKAKDIKPGMYVAFQDNPCDFYGVAQVCEVQTNPPRMKLVLQAKETKAFFANADRVFLQVNSCNTNSDPRRVKVENLRAGMVFYDWETKTLKAVRLVTKVADNVQPNDPHYEVYCANSDRSRIYPAGYEVPLFKIEPPISDERQALLDDLETARGILDVMAKEIQHIPDLKGRTATELRDLMFSISLQYQAIQIKEGYENA